MKIGVLSDTHLNRPNPFLERVIEKYFNDVDLILHAGDLTSMEVLHAFKGKEIIAVAGNSDSARVKQRLPIKEVMEARNLKIGLTHGWGLPIGLEKRITSVFKGIHCLVFGHSHWAVNHHRNGILYFNPGSFSRWVSYLYKRTIGLLVVDEDIRGKIIRL